MPSGRNYTPKDYLALGLALLLAFGVWFIHNLSLKYSELVQCSVVARCDLYGHANVSANAADVIARCNMRGFDIVSYKIGSKSKTVTVVVSPDDMKYYGDDFFYMAKDELSRYFHEFFGDKSTLEYYVTDTVLFRFPSEDYKKVPVRAVASITYKPQYMPYGKLRISPDSVLIYGNKGDIEGIHAVNTDVISFSNVSAGIVGEIAIEKIPGIRISDERVRYELPVFRYVEQEFKLPVETVNVPSNVDAKVFPASATLKVKSIYPGLEDPSDLSVSVDFFEFEGSRSGKCLGKVTGLQSKVIDYSLEPEIFDCVIEIKE